VPGPTPRPVRLLAGLAKAGTVDPAGLVGVAGFACAGGLVGNAGFARAAWAGGLVGAAGFGGADGSADRPVIGAARPVTRPDAGGGLVVPEAGGGLVGPDVGGRLVGPAVVDGFLDGFVDV
jgi:hypothetical protein